MNIGFARFLKIYSKSNGLVLMQVCFFRELYYLKHNLLLKPICLEYQEASLIWITKFRTCTINIPIKTINGTNYLPTEDKTCTDCKTGIGNQFNYLFKCSEIDRNYDQNLSQIIFK